LCIQGKTLLHASLVRPLDQPGPQRADDGRGRTAQLDPGGANATPGEAAAREGGAGQVGALAILFLLLILAFAAPRWGYDSRATKEDDRFFWPNG
jgi:hypothetical protein